jgi:hypothetical protein
LFFKPAEYWVIAAVNVGIPRLQATPIPHANHC